VTKCFGWPVFSSFRVRVPVITFSVTMTSCTSFFSTCWRNSLKGISCCLACWYPCQTWKESRMKSR